MLAEGSRGGSTPATASRFCRRSRQCGDRMSTTPLEVVDEAPRPILPTQPASGALEATHGLGSGRLEILFLSISHRAAWERLFSAYAAFYGVAQQAGQRDAVWAWLCDAAHPLRGLLAVDASDGPIGFVTFRAVPQKPA